MKQIIRIWLIKLLAGNMGIVLNVHAKFKPLYPGQPLYGNCIKPLYELNTERMKKVIETFDKQL